MNFKCFKFFPFVAIVLLFSCTPRKNLVYFQDSAEGREAEFVNKFEPKIEIGDIISVEVSGVDQDVVKPFVQSDLDKQTDRFGSYEGGAPASYGYLVNSDSTITLPVAGSVIVAGLSRSQATAVIAAKLSEYIDNPIISIRILNFKVTILGEVENPGTFSIPNERITIIEAIGIANDLKITGIRNNVLVIRIENNVKKEYRLDLTSSAIFESPVYFLKQNDIVYVEPNKKARYESGLLRSAGGVIISATSLVISTLILITK